MTYFESVVGIVIYITLLAILFCLTYLKKWYILNEQNLLEQKLFWLSIGVPILSFIYFGLFSWWGKTPILSAHGYARFYEISKFPLMLLASSVPLGAIVNNIHRTIQTEAQLDRTKHQIELLKEKNKSDSFYAHQKSYADIFKTLPPFLVGENDDGKIKTEISIDYPYILYRNIFTDSSVDNGYNKNISEKFTNNVEKYYDNINKSINAVLNKKPDTYNQLLFFRQLGINVLLLCRELGINYENEKSLYQFLDVTDNTFFYSSFGTETHIKQTIIGLRELLSQLYTLIGLSPSVFQKNKCAGDVISYYGCDNSLIFPDVVANRQLP